jgi:D-cysteine desulfhydrase
VTDVLREARPPIRLGRRAAGGLLLAGAARWLAACRDARRSAASTSPPPALAPSTTAAASSAPEPPRYPLFERAPVLERALPRSTLASLPTPVTLVEELGAALGVPALWVKRDDRTSHVYGGGKARKLELFFGDALAGGARRVVTFGGAGSNQALATARLGETLGIEVEVCLAPQPPSETVRRNLLALSATRAAVRFFPSVHEAERAVATDRDGAYVIPMGGTSPLGNLSFVSAGLELAGQIERGECPRPARVVVALGSGGSALGIAVGLALAGIESDVVGVRASNPATVTDATLAELHARTVAFARASGLDLPALSRLRLRIEGRFLGRGYGFATEAGEAAGAKARELAGLELEPVYTEKALAACAAEPTRETVLFWASAAAPPSIDGARPERLPAPLARLARATPPA